MYFDITTLNSVGFENLSEFAIFVLNFAISFSVIIAVVSLIISGFKYILSMGDEEKVKSATKGLTFSLVGLILVFISPRIIEFIIQNILVTQ